MNASDLKVGAYYFFLTYQDRDLTVPVIETLLYKAGTTNTDKQPAHFLFDRISESGPSQCRLSEDLLHTVFSFDALVSELVANREAQRSGRVYQPSVEEEP